MPSTLSTPTIHLIALALLVCIIAGKGKFTVLQWALNNTVDIDGLGTPSRIQALLMEHALLVLAVTAIDRTVTFLVGV